MIQGGGEGVTTRDLKHWPESPLVFETIGYDRSIQFSCNYVTTHE